jgi:hypothetical protein
MHATGFRMSGEAIQASRAFGAMIIFPFGGILLAVWNSRVDPGNVLNVVAIAAATIGFTAAAFHRFRSNRAALKAEPKTESIRRAGRIYNAVNLAQWVAILVLGNVLANIGLGAWVVPMAIFVVGLHFLPLAHVFANPAHYLTGAALMLYAAGYPQVAAGGPADPVGFLGAGLILWAAALAAVTRRAHPLG